MANGRRATTVVIEDRITEVVRWITMGLTRAEIVQKGSEKWEITERQVDDYIKRANAEFTKESNVNRKAAIGKAIRRYEYILQKCLSVQDFQRALAAQKELCALLGLNEPAKHNINIDLAKLTDEQLRLVAAGKMPAEIGDTE